MITLVMLTCKRLKTFINTMEALIANCSTQFTDWIVIDDNSSPADRLVMKERYPFITLIEKTPEEKGQVTSLNKIFDNVKTPYVFYLEDDWELQKPLDVEEYLPIFRDHRIKQICFSLPWAAPPEGHSIYKYNCTNEQPHQIEYRKDYYPTYNEKEEDGFPWPGFTLRPALWDIIYLRENIGKFNTRLGPSYHDYDYAVRYSLQGKKVGVTPDFFTHDESNPSAFSLNGDKRLWDKGLPTLVVGSMIDIGRDNIDGRTSDHYWNSLEKIIKLPNPIVMVTESKYIDRIKQMRGFLPIEYIDISTQYIEKTIPSLPEIYNIFDSKEWKSQAPWMRDSVLANSPYYIPLTLIKQHFLQSVADKNPFKSEQFLWLDVGVCSSYELDSIAIPKIEPNKFNLYSYPYTSNTEVHGFDVKGMTKYAGRPTDYVCRGTFFGGDLSSITYVSRIYDRLYHQSLKDGYLGTEESLYTILSYQEPSYFNVHKMPNGEIGNMLGERNDQ